jgi:hypothetical protein
MRPGAFASSMVEVFMFRCRTCGRVAPHQFWRPRSAKKGSAPEVMMQYPSPECPQCSGINIDVNHGYADGEEGDRLLKEYRQKLLAMAPGSQPHQPNAPLKE